MRKSLAALARDLPGGSARRPIRVSVKGKEPLVARDEVVTVVLGPDGALVHRSTSPSGAVDLRELELRLLGAEAAVDAALATAANAEVPPLGRVEAGLLDEAGLTDGGAGSEPGALERSQIAYQLLIQSSLSLLEAGRALGVTPARLRQRLAARTLLGLKDGRSWRLPRFQFAGKGRLVPGIEQVLPRIRADAHLLAVQRWLQTPHQDLVLGASERPVSPLQWLGAGHPPAAVAAVASEI